MNACMCTCLGGPRSFIVWVLCVSMACAWFFERVRVLELTGPHGAHQPARSTTRCPSLQDCLALGSILAATDSVAALQVIQQERFPLLYSVVFGEGVINDATSIVILGTIQVSRRMEQAVAVAFVGMVEAASSAAAALQCSWLLEEKVHAFRSAVK